MGQTSHLTHTFTAEFDHVHVSRVRERRPGPALTGQPARNGFHYGSVTDIVKALQRCNDRVGLGGGR